MHGAEAGQGLEQGLWWILGGCDEGKYPEITFSSQSGAFVTPFQSLHFDGTKDSVCSNINFKHYFNKGVAFYLYKFLWFFFLNSLA